MGRFSEMGQRSVKFISNIESMLIWTQTLPQKMRMRLGLRYSGFLQSMTVPQLFALLPLNPCILMRDVLHSLDKIRSSILSEII